MCQLVFKDSIDYSKVYIQIGGFISIIINLTDNAMTPFGNVNVSNKNYFENLAFSKSKGNAQHWFIHEMTHVWQYQMGTKNAWLGLEQLLCKSGYIIKVDCVDSGLGELKAYDTDITGKDLNKKFKDFNFEQQGRIIEFWFNACYLQNIVSSRPHHQKSLKLLGYVERILRDFLDNPHDPSLLPRS
ncbi:MULTISPECIES: zinc protease [unclassified Acinetobacter]|uniref:zinc protease n=1 Tax=unclassified Acinetobacter TaxID=196816 RepID=UPI001D0E6E0A|nr:MULTISPECIES: zinc protease [unclassified Acinetobacter]